VLTADIPANETRAVRVFVTAPVDAVSAHSTPAQFEVRMNGADLRAATSFQSGATSPR
jgi:pyridoxine/pyridoxamine 5'-phosphate oxidase